MGLALLAFALAGRVLRQFDPHPPPAIDNYEGPPMLWDEADDTWPTEEPEQITQTLSDPELIVTPQWGLRLPGGHIAWNSWAGIWFDHPLHRLTMIAKLQATAGELGFSEGPQVSAFLAQYDWVTRNQIATVVYEDTGAYLLTDSEVSTLGIPGSGESPDDDNHTQKEDGSGDLAPSPGDDSHRGLCEGPVGGDAP